MVQDDTRRHTEVNPHVKVTVTDAIVFYKALLTEEQYL